MNLLCNHCGIKAQTLQDAVIGKNKTQQHLLWITVKTRHLLFKLSQLNKKSQKYGQHSLFNLCAVLSNVMTSCADLPRTFIAPLSSVEEG